MCKEDIRIARAAGPGRAVVATGGAADQRLLGANANRYSLSLTMLGVRAAGAVGTTVVYAMIGGAKHGLGGVSFDQPFNVVTISDVGAAIQGDIWVATLDLLNATSIGVAETEFLTDLESI